MADKGKGKDDKKQEVKLKKTSHKWSKYEKAGEELKRKTKFCPKCGPGVFLAAHKDRLTCGACGYTEFQGKGSGESKESKQPASPKGGKPEEKPVQESEEKQGPAKGKEQPEPDKKKQPEAEQEQTKPEDKQEKKKEEPGSGPGDKD
ncbi:30S ribosomal protein S27ae [Candidatus Woesearchaeota archaeon]|nr:30S ribosomal protein S27ae [Candidatus Woesearchaeota archaeon]